MSIPGEPNTLPADTTAEAAAKVGMTASTAPDVDTALRQLTEGNQNIRVLICGSLYLAGQILKQNG